MRDEHKQRSGTGRSIAIELAVGNAAAYIVIRIGEYVRMPLAADILVVAVVVVCQIRVYGNLN